MLTSTANTLLAMTDRAAFERLALQVLRSAEVDCASVIRLGTNANGETIVSPLDGFACAPGTSTPLYIAVESTTTDVSGLERKWLHDHRTTQGRKPSKKAPSEADDGDLLKAAREAEMLRARAPNATCKIYLVTNQIVPSELRAKVDQVARSLHVNCDVWEQSRISDYLDITPTGQYLRSKYFGIPAERLSKDLLLDVSKMALLGYGHAGRVSSTPATWVPRALDLQVLARIDDSATRAVILVGESGFGKSIAAYRAIETWLHRGAPALWITAELIETANSLHAAIDEAIRDRVPTLAENSVRNLSEALGGGRLLVAIDDINRARSPGKLFRKILTWSSSIPEVVVLCPLWPRFLDPFHLADRKDVSLVRVGSFAPSEAEDALGGPDRQSFSAALQYDPFLIGVARMLAASGASISTSTKARDVLALFVDRELELLRSGDSTVPAICHKSEHREAIERTSRGSLEHRNLSPTALEAREWIADERVWTAMVEVLHSSGIAWTTQNGQLHYRHDRLRDHLLAMAMSSLLARGDVCTAFTDPYFAEVSAEALIQLGAPDELVANAGRNEPLVLAVALRFADAGSDAEQRIARALMAWFSEERSRHGLVRVRFIHKDSSANSVYAAGSFNNWNGSDDAWRFTRTPGTDDWALVRWMPAGTHEYKVVVDGARWIGSGPAHGAPDGFGAFNAVAKVPKDRVDARFVLTSGRARIMVRELARTDSLAVLDIARELPEANLDVLLARLRNGDARAGIQFCQSRLGEPTSSYMPRAGSIAAAQRLHLQTLAEEFQEAAREITSDDERLGAIVFAGHLGQSSMIAETAQLWRGAESRRQLLPHAIWAQLRRPDPDFATIEEMLLEFLKLAGEAQGDAHISERGKVKEFLRLSGVRIGPSIVTWLVALMERRAEFEGIAWTLLASVDLPDAVEAMVRLAAKAEESARAMGGFSLGASMLGDAWRRSDKQMSASSARRLQEIWQSELESRTVRWRAFGVWKIAALHQSGALEVLQTLGPESPLYAPAVRCRALLGDVSAEPAFAELLTKETFGARAGSRIWGANIAAAVDIWLPKCHGDSDNSHAIADLLELAPTGAARKLLVKNWDSVRHIRRLLQAALTIGGPELETRAAEAIATWPLNLPPPLEYAVTQMETGHEDGLVVPIDKDRIARLLPYSDRLGEFDLQRLAESARKHGLATWGRERIAPLLDDRARAQVFPTPNDMKVGLDELIQDERTRSLRTRRFAELAEERSDGLYNPLDVLAQWLAEKNGSEAALEIAAEIIVVLGQRSGIGILARHSEHSNTLHMQRLADVELQVRRASL